MTKRSIKKIERKRREEYSAGVDIAGWKCKNWRRSPKLRDGDGRRKGLSGQGNG